MRAATDRLQGLAPKRADRARDRGHALEHVVEAALQFSSRRRHTMLTCDWSSDVCSSDLSWGDAGIALSIFGTTLGVAGIVANGTSEQVAEWLPQCFGTPDDIRLAAFGVSEPDAGSDVSSLRSRAVYDEAKDEWRLNGTKTWITNGGIADVHILVLSVDPSLGSRGHAAFVVGPGTPGIRQGQKFKKHGIRASHTAEVILEDCRVPGSWLLGGKEKLDARLARAREGKSSRSQAAMSTFETTRPAVGAQAVGIA